MLNIKPPGGRTNLFHHLLISPSLNPSNISFPLFLSILPVWSARFYHGCLNTGRGYGRLPNTPHATLPQPAHIDTLDMSQISSGGSARLASSLLLPLHLGCSLFLWTLVARSRWNRGATVQPPCNRPTHPGYPPAMWSAYWDGGKAVQREEEQCALAMLISLELP